MSGDGVVILELILKTSVVERSLRAPHPSLLPAA
jgi:hypothetical protein